MGLGQRVRHWDLPTTCRMAPGRRRGRAPPRPRRHRAARRRDVATSQRACRRRQVGHASGSGAPGRASDQELGVLFDVDLPGDRIGRDLLAHAPDRPAAFRQGDRGQADQRRALRAGLIAVGWRWRRRGSSGCRWPHRLYRRRRGLRMLTLGQACPCSTPDATPSTRMNGRPSDFSATQHGEARGVPPCARRVTRTDHGMPRCRAGLGSGSWCFRPDE
jgi:hypothetical protein